MGVIMDYLRQKAPRSGREMPRYYQRALSINADILSAHFLMCWALFSMANARAEWVLAGLTAAMILCRVLVGHANVRLVTYGYALTTVVWCWWITRTLGWGNGSHELLIPVLMLMFFNVYEPSWMKVAAFLLVVGYQMALFSWSLEHAATYSFERTAMIAYQTMNSVTLFFTLAVDFVLFSSNIQAMERQLRLDNQELHKEAGTDPLTKLPNRRAMLDHMDAFSRANPEGQYCIAIADIDYFKHVNDTYGHNCGDYTLEQLSRLFRESSQGAYGVCRWGGEEFCFFLPDKNLDEAGRIMFDLHIAVRKLPLSFDGNDFNITITIGVAENDFQSPMEKILEQADQKLYRGKLEGRNRVVV